MIILETPWFIECNIAIYLLYNVIAFILMIQISSGITSGRVLNGELYAQRLQKLTYLH